MAGFLLEEILRGGELFKNSGGLPPVKKGGNFSLGGQILKVVDTIHWVVPGSRTPVSYALTTFLLSTMPRPCGVIVVMLLLVPMTVRRLDQFLS